MPWRERANGGSVRAGGQGAVGGGAVGDLELLSMQGMGASAPWVHDIAAYGREAAVAALGLQILWLGWTRGRAWLRELVGSLGSLALALGIGKILGGAWIMEASWLAWSHRAATLPDAWWSWLLCLALFDYWGYWLHRAKHSTGLLWAYHESHHSYEDLDLTANLRNANLNFAFGWLGAIIPLSWLGFHPLAVASCMFASGAFQMASHAHGAMGPSFLDRIFSTPAVHAIHHAKNLPYLDKNFGEILTVWDQLHGTYASPRAASEAPIFGDSLGPAGINPLNIAFRGFADLFSRARATPRWPDKLRLLWKSPGWSPERGEAGTTRGLRAAAASRASPASDPRVETPPGLAALPSADPSAPPEGEATKPRHRGEALESPL